jgi:Zn-dependent peptidase ImmA (M78 family)/transcriptional regulator with XRE-family HTH domain
MFDPSKLTLARQLAGLRKIDLATLVGMTPASVSAWESGGKRPNSSAIARLCMALQVEPTFFASASGAALATVPHFRSLRSTSQMAQDQAFAYGKIAADIAMVLEKTVEFPVPNVPSYPVSTTDPVPDAPERAAQHLRRQLRLPAGPIKHLVRLAEDLGVLVVFSAPQTAAIDAFSFESSARPVIVLNPEKNDYYRQRFDVAHELGHLVMHSDSEPGGRVVEDQAHRFAAEFLTPCEQIRSSLPAQTTVRGWATLRQLKEHWGVSMQALLYRSRALGVMGEVPYRNAMMNVSKKGWRRGEPGDVVSVEMPSLIPKAVDVLIDAGISPSDIVRGPGLPLPLFELVSSRTPVRASNTIPLIDAATRSI